MSKMFKSFNYSLPSSTMYLESLVRPFSYKAEINNRFYARKKEQIL
jgi:hypothetical protein